MLETSKPWINTIIMDELSKIEPLLNLAGDDHKLLQICCNDFWDYATYLQRNFQRIASDNAKQDTPLVQEFHIEADEFGNYAVSEVVFESMNIEEVLECVQLFVKTWWRKYKQRVKITFEIKKQDSLTEKGRTVVQNHFTLEETHDIVTILTDTFLRCGEYCMAKLLAENLFQRTIGQSAKEKWSQEDKINLVTQMRREAKNISYLHGALMFIKPDLKLYGLREWRDSNANVMK
jgi:hypothetical protein